MKKYNPEELLISLHIAKTAGSSLRVILQEWFGERLHLHYPACPNPLKSTNLSRDACVHGHFKRSNGSSIQQFYPDASQVITVMRDPFERLISEWRFKSMMKRAGKDIIELRDDPDFDTWFNRISEKVERDKMTPLMEQMPEDLYPETVNTAFDRLFVAVGIHERFNETVRLFSCVLGKPYIAPERFNVTDFDDDSDFEIYRSRHEKVFRPDYIMYEAAKTKFENQIDAIDLR